MPLSTELNQKPPQVSLEQITDEVSKWKRFWEPPRGLTEDNIEAWLETYHCAVNQSHNLQTFWGEVCKRITTKCRFFPYPSDLIAVADAIRCHERPY